MRKAQSEQAQREDMRRGQGSAARGTATRGTEPEGLLAAARRHMRRVWPSVALVLAAVLWWPAGFWGLESWLHLPLDVTGADVLLVSGTAAGATAAALATSPWPRLAIVVAFSGIGWLLSGPTGGAAGDGTLEERSVLLGALAAAALLGIALGSRARRSPLTLATALAVVAALSQATWPRGLVLAVALALPFLAATRDRVAPTLLSVARVLLTWLVVSVLVLALRHGWDVLGPSLPGGSAAVALRQVAEASWDFLRTQWQSASSAVLQDNITWFWVALALALVLVTARALLRLGSARRGASPVR